MPPTTALFDRRTIDEARWPATPLGQRARAYLIPLIKGGITRSVANVTAELFVLFVDDKVLPITVANRARGNSYVASPTTFYVNLSRLELEAFPSKWLAAGCKLLIDLMRPVLRICDFEKTILVNNWLFATNQYPALTRDDIVASRDILCDRFPDHCIVFRTVDEYFGAATASLEEEGFFRVFHRPTYVLDPAAPDYRRRRNLRDDIKLLRRSPYELTEITEPCSEAAARMQRLYEMLYIDKYTEYNPHYTSEFFSLAIQNPEMQVVALRSGERIDGVIIYCPGERNLIVPLIGYDTTLPQEVGLYRALIAAIIVRAEELGLPVNLSAGVGAFKRTRGAELTIEYIGVYCDHLSFRRRLPWRILHRLNKTMVPLLSSFDI